MPTELGFDPALPPSDVPKSCEVKNETPSIPTTNPIKLAGIIIIMLNTAPRKDWRENNTTRIRNRHRDQRKRNAKTPIKNVKISREDLAYFGRRQHILRTQLRDDEQADQPSPPRKESKGKIMPQRNEGEHQNGVHYHVVGAP